MNEWISFIKLKSEWKQQTALGIVYTKKYNHSYLTTAYIKDKKAKNER